LIEAWHITKSFKSLKAVDDITLKIKKGEYLALLGPNGAGKTTLVEILEGVQKQDLGEVHIDGCNWQHHRTQLRKKIGITLQETRFIEKLNVKETMELFASFHHLPKKRVEEVIHLVNLNHKTKTYTINLSGGQRQKLALGIAILQEPEILFLDEPTTGLDPNARREIWQILLQLRKEKNATMILTTHYMEEAEYLCERIVIMDQGKILADGTMDDLLTQQDLDDVIQFEFEKEGEAAFINQLPGFRAMHWEQQNCIGKIMVDNASKALPEFLNRLNYQGLRLKSLESRRKTLDDLFVSLTGRRLNE